MLRYLMVLALPIAMGGWALADQIIPFLFDVGYKPAVPIMQIMIWVVPLMFASEFLGYIVVIAGQESRVARSIAVSTTLNVVLNIILIPRFGIQAAAIMTVFTEAVLVTQYVWILRTQLRQIRWSNAVLRPFVAASITCGSALLLHGYLPIILNIGASALVYVVLLIVLGLIGIDEQRFISNFWQPSTTPAAIGVDHTSK